MPEAEVIAQPLRSTVLLGEGGSDPKFKIFTGALKAYEQEGRKVLSCTASSSVEDLHGDTMTDECVRDMAAQAKVKNMTIFLNHKYAVPEDVFGSTIDTRTTSRSADETGKAIWDLDLDMTVNEANPRAINTYNALKDQGVKLGVSIGAMISEWEFKDKEKGFFGGMTIKKVDLLEASIVGIPANPRSWVQNAVKAIKSLHGEDEIELEPGSDEKTAEADGIVKDGVEVPEGKSATLTVNADGTSSVEIHNDTNAAPEEETPAEDKAEDEATKAEEPTSPVDLDAAKLAAADLDTSETDPTTKGLILQLIAGIEQAVQEKDAALAERDAALAKVIEKDGLLADAAEIIATIATTPLGRKTAFTGPAKTFRSRFAGMYDEGFLKMLEKD
jgi:HK97 family phage prohead protease